MYYGITYINYRYAMMCTVTLWLFPDGYALLPQIQLSSQDSHITVVLAGKRPPRQRVSRSYSMNTYSRGSIYIHEIVLVITTQLYHW